MGLNGQKGGQMMFKMDKGKLKNEMDLRNGPGTYNYQTFDTHVDNFSQFFTGTHLAYLWGHFAPF